MSLVNKERTFLIVFIALTMALLVSAKGLNQRSFGDIASIVYGIGTEIGNLREGPSTKHPVVERLNEGSLFRITSREGDWFLGRYGLTEGWAHKSILRKYIHLSYYDDYVVGESLLEIIWD